MSAPNLVFILTDQQRVDTIRAWGNPHVLTPNLDRLTEESISFRQSFCPGATCIASRAAIFTGMYAHNTGIYSFHPWAHHRTFVHELRDAGYHCANIGKMHLDPRDAAAGFHDRIVVENPTAKFSAAEGEDDWGKFLVAHGEVRPNDREQTDPDWNGKLQGVPWHLDEKLHSDRFVGDSAVNWIAGYEEEKPFFLEVGLPGPHEPWDPPPRILEQYEGIEMPEPIDRGADLDKRPPQWRAHLDFFRTAKGEARIDLDGATPEAIARMRRHYYAKITHVDEQIGRVVAALEARGHLKNTWIIFTSDHGEALGDHGMIYKWLMHEPCVHVPCLIRPPGGTRPRDVDELVSLMDLAPTFLDLAGAPTPTWYEGRSIRPYVDGAPIAPREHVVCEDNYLVMYRTRTTKLVYYFGQEEGELYDLSTDPHEIENLWDSSDHCDLRRDMCQRLLEWLGSSCYHAASYKQQNPHLRLRWPERDNRALHGPDAGQGDKPCL